MYILNFKMVFTHITGTPRLIYIIRQRKLLHLQCSNLVLLFKYKNEY